MADDTVEAIELSDVSTGDTCDTSNTNPDFEHDVALASLKKDVKDLIRPYEDSKRKPPFSTAELIVMAMIRGGQATYSTLDILHDICTTFRYYERAALKRCFNNAETSGTGLLVRMYEDNEGLEGVLGQFERQFFRYDLPIAVVDYELLEKTVLRHPHIGLLHDCEVSITPQAARLFLGTRVYERQGKFPFLKLPAGLRNEIYEMLLHFPSPGFRPSPRALELLRLPNDDDLPVTTENIYPGYDVVTGNMLSLLQVCKQIQNEARPIFYGMNVFCFDHTDYFYSMMGLSPRALEHLRKVYLDPISMFSTTFQDVGRLLASIKKFDLLILEIDDRDWLHMSKEARYANFTRKNKFTKPGQIKGLEKFAEAATKAVTFELRGNCPLTRTFFDAEMERIKCDEAKSTGLKKRSRKPKDKKAGDKAAAGRSES